MPFNGHHLFTFAFETNSEKTTRRIQRNKKFLGKVAIDSTFYHLCNLLGVITDWELEMLWDREGWRSQRSSGKSQHYFNNGYWYKSRDDFTDYLLTWYIFNHVLQEKEENEKDLDCQLKGKMQANLFKWEFCCKRKNDSRYFSFLLSTWTIVFSFTQATKLQRKS